MTWNYRVMEKIQGAGTQYEETVYCICEVYYEDDGSIMGWTEDKAVWGENVEDLHETLEYMILCLEKPILNEAELLAEMAARPERPEEPSETYLTLDEVLESLGLEREDVDISHGFKDRTQEVDDMINDPEFSEAIKRRRKEMEDWENEGGLPTWNGPDSP